MGFESITEYELGRWPIFITLNIYKTFAIQTKMSVTFCQSFEQAQEGENVQIHTTVKLKADQRDETTSTV